MRVIAIDPGYDRVGWAVGDVSGRQLQLVDSGLLQPPAGQLFDRYQHLIKLLTEILTKYQPQQAALEEVFFSTNRKTAITVSEARGVLLGCLIIHQVAPHTISPTTVKSRVTGDGRANKAAMHHMLALQLKLNLAGKIDDEVDAIGILFAFVLGHNPNFYRIT